MRRRGLAILSAVLGLTIAVFTAHGQQIHRNAFEARHTSWQKGAADAPHQELLHEMTTSTSHSGQQSEHIKLTAESGSNIYYLYPVPKTDVLEELVLSVAVRGNRPGMQLMARLVLPRERDPGNLDQPLTTLIRGDAYQLAGRWQRLEFRAPPRIVQQQQQLLRAQLKRDVNFDAAYIDQVVLNVYAGKGLTEVWIDDLEVGPIFGDAFQPVKPPKTAEAPAGRATPGTPASLQSPRHAVVELNHDRLQINRRPFLVRGIRHSNTPLKALRDAGFNTLFVDDAVKEDVLQEAVNLGFWIVLELPVLEDNPRWQAPASLDREVAQFPFNDAILFWHIGSGLTAEQAEPVARAAKAIRAADPFQGRPVAGNIWDGFRPYSRHLDMVGIHRWPLMTDLELHQYRQWLVQRVDLAEPRIYTWTWVQTHLPEWYVRLVHQHPSEDGFSEPIGPQPEQIRLLTYIALSAGYRGLGFWSDQFLANSHHGRDRLLQLALLNQELEMLEPMLATVKDIHWVNTKNSEVKAAVFRYDGGVLVIPIWLGKGAQFVPGQLATNNLEIIVPGAPLDAQVWEVSPGDVHSLRHERVAGGVKVTIPEFGLTTAIVFTSDVNATDGGQIGRLQQAARRTRKLAAQWSYDLAIEELAKVERVNALLEGLGHRQPDGQALLTEARQRLEAARTAWTRDTQADHRAAYADAQRALRALRILMRAQWERATKPLDSPVSSPYAVSFFSLPQHWEFAERIRGATGHTNLLANGDFELSPDRAPDAWSVQEVTLDKVKLSAKRAAERPKEGKQCLVLEVKPQADDPRLAPAALERTFLAVHSPEMTLQPGSIVRISGWVRIPEPIKASVDGVLFYDSIGGEPLAIRLNGATPWRKFTLYRPVPPSGKVSVTMALTGIGTAYFDNVKVEPLHAGGPAPLQTTVASPFRRGQ